MNDFLFNIYYYISFKTPIQLGQTIQSIVLPSCWHGSSATARLTYCLSNEACQGVKELSKTIVLIVLPIEACVLNSF